MGVGVVRKRWDLYVQFHNGVTSEDVCYAFRYEAAQEAWPCEHGQEGVNVVDRVCVVTYRVIGVGPGLYAGFREISFSLVGQLRIHAM